MSIENQIISEIKIYINKGDLDGIKILFNQYIENTDFGRELSWEFIFHTIYIHSALKKQTHICNWLDTIFSKLNPITQIALKHTLIYSKYLLNKN